MLLELRVKNFAIINEALINFEDGFNVLTGETGAGKSLLVDALLIFFYRGGAEYIRSGEERAFVEAYFEMEEDLKKEFEELEGEDAIVLKKVLQRDGKTKSYINGSFSTQNRVSSLLERLLHIYGQSEERELYNADYHLELFDIFSGVSSKKEELSKLVKKGREIRRELEELLSKEREREKEIDFLSYQIEEIEKAMLSDDNEEEMLKHRRDILQSRERMISNLSKVYEYLYAGEESVFDKLSFSEKALLELPLNGTEIEKLPSELAIRKEDIKGFSIEIKDFIDKLSEEEGNLDEIEERLNVLFKLKKKYGGTISEIKSYLENIQKRLEVLKNIDIYKGDIEKKLEEIRKNITTVAKDLSSKRIALKSDFEKKIIAELKDLGMEKADFEVKMEKANNKFPEDMSEKGDERIEFYFSAHKSEEKKPLNKIASGGELSRIMLAIKNVIPMEKKRTFIFDEVDSGVGGLTAEMIGRKLKQISKRHQVLCITHLPQVASFADNHITVEKKEINGKIEVLVKRVEGEERIDEITRMLGGDKKSKGREYAVEILKKGGALD